MIFSINEKIRVTGGKEYIIKSISNNIIASISIPVYKIKDIDDLKNEIVKFWNISKEEIIII